MSDTRQSCKHREAWFTRNNAASSLTWLWEFEKAKDEIHHYRHILRVRQIGASEGIRTLDTHVGNVMLYQAELRSLPTEV
jgi:hypothetical protein